MRGGVRRVTRAAALDCRGAWTAAQPPRDTGRKPTSSPFDAICTSRRDDAMPGERARFRGRCARWALGTRDVTHLTLRATPRRAGRLATRGGAIVVALHALASATWSRIPAPDVGAPASVWVTAGIGLLQTESIADGRTQSAWDLDANSAQWRASINTKPRGLSLSVTGAYAQIPTTYVAIGPDPAPPIEGDAPCLATGACSATTDVLTLLATARLGGGRGLHQVLELALGASGIASFRTDDGSRLAPEQDTDFTGTIGYGVGYGFSDYFQVAIVQDFGFNVHQRDDLPSSANSLTRRHVTRLTARFGFAERRVR